jgi:hypothetical protein
MTSTTTAPDQPAIDHAAPLDPVLHLQADPAAVREIIAETACSIGIYANILQDAASIPDDGLARYATKAIIASVRAARDAVRMLPPSIPADPAPLVLQ